MSNFFMSMNSGSPTASYGLTSDISITQCAQPSTMVETDENTGIRTETTTWYEQFDIPEDDETEIRQSMLDEYERSLGRHEATFLNLLRLYKKQKKFDTKLTFTLEQEKKKQEKQQKKQKALVEAAENLTKGLPKLAKKPDEKQDDGRTEPEQATEPSGQRVDTDNLKRMIDEVGRKMDDLRRRKDVVDKRHAKLKARLDEAGQTNEKDLDAEINKLASEVYQAKANLSRFLNALNSGLVKISNHLKKEYRIQQNPPTSNDVRWNLEQLLNDVKYLMGEKNKNEEEIDILQGQIDELEKLMQATEDLHKMLINETRKLLTIGNRREAKNVDPENFADVIKFVEETFEELLKALKNQNMDIDQANAKLKELENEEERRQNEFNQEKLVKQSKIDRIQRNVEELLVKNQRLKEDLNRPISTSAEPEEANTEQVFVQKIMQDMTQMDGQQNKSMENRLERVKKKNTGLRSQLKDLTSGINDLEDKVRQRQNYLEFLQEQAVTERDKDGKISSDLEQQITDVQKRVDELEKELSNLLNRIGDPSEYRNEKDGLNERERYLSERIRIVDDNLQQADADGNQLNNQRVGREGYLDNLYNTVDDQQRRENDLNNDLNDVRSKIDDTDKLLRRERERNLLMEREKRQYSNQGVEFVQTTVTRMRAVGQSEQKMLTSSDDTSRQQRD